MWPRFQASKSEENFEICSNRYDEVVRGSSPENGISNPKLGLELTLSIGPHRTKGTLIRHVAHFCFSALMA
jgi:hypothetical protein